MTGAQIVAAVEQICKYTDAVEDYAQPRKCSQSNPLAARAARRSENNDYFWFEVEHLEQLERKSEICKRTDAVEDYAQRRVKARN